MNSKMKSKVDNPFVLKIRKQQQFFHRSVSCFVEEDADFQPTASMLTTAGQILHTAIGIEFFLSGMFGPFEGFSSMSRLKIGFPDLTWLEIAESGDPHVSLDGFLDLNFGFEIFEVSQSIALTLDLFDKAMDTATKMFDSKTLQQIQTEVLPINPPFSSYFSTRSQILELALDHTAHHRGSLVVYAHLLGKEPKIPYFEMSALRTLSNSIIAKT